MRKGVKYVRGCIRITIIKTNEFYFYFFLNLHSRIFKIDFYSNFMVTIVNIYQKNLINFLRIHLRYVRMYNLRHKF